MGGAANASNAIGITEEAGKVIVVSKVNSGYSVCILAPNAIAARYGTSHRKNDHIVTFLDNSEEEEFNHRAEFMDGVEWRPDLQDQVLKRFSVEEAIDRADKQGLHIVFHDTQERGSSAMAPGNVPYPTGRKYSLKVYSEREWQESPVSQLLLWRHGHVLI